MKFKTIGKDGSNGFKVSVIGLGCNAFGRRCNAAQTAAIVDRAIDAGINFFDTAAFYGDGLSEEYIGKALGARRGDVFIATKFGARGGASRKAVLASAEASLKRLGTDYIDLYQLHKPDPAISIEETLAALEELVQSGKVRTIGCSNFSGNQLEEARAASSASGGAQFVTAQKPYNLLQRGIENDLVPVCREHGIGILPYHPIFRGLLTGKYRRGEPPPAGTRLAGGGRGTAILNDKPVFDKIESLEAFAQERGYDILTLALAWLAAQPFIPSVIAGASKPEQVAANARAADCVLSQDDRLALDAISPAGATWKTSGWAKVVTVWRLLKD